MPMSDCALTTNRLSLLTKTNLLAESSKSIGNFCVRTFSYLRRLASAIHQWQPTRMSKATTLNTVNYRTMCAQTFVIKHYLRVHILSSFSHLPLWCHKRQSLPPSTISAITHFSDDISITTYTNSFAQLVSTAVTDECHWCKCPSTQLYFYDYAKNRTATKWHWPQFQRRQSPDSLTSRLSSKVFCSVRVRLHVKMGRREVKSRYTVTRSRAQESRVAIAS